MLITLNEIQAMNHSNLRRPSAATARIRLMAQLGPVCAEISLSSCYVLTTTIATNDNHASTLYYCYVGKLATCRRLLHIFKVCTHTIYCRTPTLIDYL